MSENVFLTWYGVVIYKMKVELGNFLLLLIDIKVSLYSIIFASQGLLNMGSGVDRKPLASEDGTLFSFDILIRSFQPALKG